MAGRSPKIPTFSGSDPERLERGPQCFARRRNFQKSPHAFVVLRLGYNPSQRKYTSSFQYPCCPNQKTKMFLPVLALFSTKWLGHSSFQDKLSFHWLSSSPDAKLKTYKGIFENFAYRPRYGCISTGLLRQDQKSWAVFRGRIWKLGDKLLPHKKFSAFTT